MDAKEVMELEDTYTINVFAKRPVVIVGGKGAVVWDINGKKYIDCVAGHGVCITGHSHPKVVEAIASQAERLIVCPGIFYNDVRARLAERIAEITPDGLTKVFLSNSGAEAVECALKLARKFTKRKEFVSTMGGFHGRTMGALSVTWKPKYRKPFEPLLSHVKFVPYGNVEKLEEAVTKDTAAVIVEPVQGEGGVIIPPDGYLKAVREICDEKGAVLIIDEIQTGFGRTGKLFACEHWNVQPDIMCLAKGVAGGVPMGVTVTTDEISRSLGIGEHGSTFGGNPLACAAALAAIDVIIGENLPQRAAVLGRYFKDKLEEFGRKYRIVREVRGIGLMIGIELRLDCHDVIMDALERGVLLLTAGRNVIRMLPPLVISKEEIDFVIKVLDECLREKESKVFH
ncbi:MAG: aspartate aminotransferase family protein [Candidatus Baldrarchaeia archaeon]